MRSQILKHKLCNLMSRVVGSSEAKQTVSPGLPGASERRYIIFELRDE